MLLCFFPTNVFPVSERPFKKECTDVKNSKIKDALCEILQVEHLTLSPEFGATVYGNSLSEFSVAHKSRKILLLAFKEKKSQVSSRFFRSVIVHRFGLSSFANSIF